MAGLLLKDPLGIFPEIDLNWGASSDYYKPEKTAWTLSTITTAGAPVLQGPTYNIRHAWRLSLKLPHDDALMVEAYWLAQARDYTPRREYLIFENQIDEVTPEPAPHRRQLIAGTQRSLPGGLVTGMARYPVLLSILSDDARIREGISARGCIDRIGITLHELVGVTLP
jgi:hypothetical protein